MVCCARCQRAIEVCVAHWDIVVGRDWGSCGEIGGPCGSGIGFYVLGPHGSESPGAIGRVAIDPNPNPRLLGFWVGRVGLGFHVFYIRLHI